MSTHVKSDGTSLEDRLVEQFGELIEAGELAKLLRYRSALTLKRAIDAGRIPLQLAKVGQRNVISTRRGAQYLINAGGSEAPNGRSTTGKEGC